jgi:hypothetical protein
MPVPTIPSTISLDNIQTEFGGSNPIGINEYYAGASPLLVPSGTANATSVAIPTSGTISFANFSGAAALSASLPSWNSGGGYDNNIIATVNDFTCSGANAEIYLYVNSNGTIVYNDMLNNYSHTWRLVGNASDFYFRFDISTGAVASGSSATGTNLQMNANYLYFVSASAACNDPPVINECTGTWSFRNAGGGVLVSQSFSMVAYAESS